MFSSLSQKFEGIFSKIRSRGKLSEKDIKETSREVRRALLEADVNVGVAKALLDGVREKALGQEVLQSLSPGQQVVGIVRVELEQLLGMEAPGTLQFASKPPTIIMLGGLQAK